VHLTLGGKRPLTSHDRGLTASEASALVIHLLVQPRVPSFLSMDVDGRVLRLDSFSKTMGGG